MDGFIHNGRRIFSLRYRLESEPPAIRELVVPLGPDGNSTGITAPADKSKRMVNVKAGDSLLHGDREYRVLGVEVYRALPID